LIRERSQANKSQPLPPLSLRERGRGRGVPFSPRPRTRGRGVGGDGVEPPQLQNNDFGAVEPAPPHPQPLAPEYGGEAGKTAPLLRVRERGEEELVDRHKVCGIAGFCIAPSAKEATSLGNGFAMSPIECEIYLYQISARIFPAEEQRIDQLTGKCPLPWPSCSGPVVRGPTAMKDVPRAERHWHISRPRSARGAYRALLPSAT